MNSTPSFRLRSADLEALRTGQPTQYTANFYPSISDYIQRYLNGLEMNNHIELQPVTKVIVAEFGGGKSSMARALRRQWLAKGMAASMIEVQEQYSMNRLHADLLLNMSAEGLNFFQLLHKVATQPEVKADDFIIRWMASNADLVEPLLTQPCFQRGFAEWFRGERIRDFNNLLASHGIQGMTVKSSENDARKFLNTFCHLLNDNFIQPILIVDELETIMAFSQDRLRQVILTQVRDLIDNAPGCYSLVITTTDDIMDMVARDYRAVYDRVYNSPTTNARACTWHLAYMRDMDAIKDHFRLIKRSDPAWKDVCDTDTDTVIDQLLNETPAHELELRITIRRFIEMLDRSMMGPDGQYSRDLLLGGGDEDEAPQEEQEEQAQPSSWDDDEETPAEWLARTLAQMEVHQADREAEDEAPFDEAYYESIAAYEPPKEVAATMTKLGQYNRLAANGATQTQSVGELPSASRFFHSSRNRKQVIKPLPNLKVSKIAKDGKEKSEDQIRREENNIKRLKRQRSGPQTLLKSMTCLANPLTIDRLAQRLAQVRDLKNSRLLDVTTDEALNMRETNGILFGNVPVGYSHLEFRVAMIEDDRGTVFLFNSQEEPPHYADMILNLIRNAPPSETLTELRRRVYHAMILHGTIKDDLWVDTLTLQAAQELMGRAPFESRNGVVFWKHRANFDGRMIEEEYRYIDALELKPDYKSKLDLQMSLIQPVSLEQQCETIEERINREKKEARMRKKQEVQNRAGCPF